MLANQKLKEVTDDVINEMLDQILAVDMTWRIERFDSFETYESFINKCRIGISKILRDVDPIYYR